MSLPLKRIVRSATSKHVLRPKCIPRSIRPMATVAPVNDLSDIGFKFGTYPVVGGDQAKPVHKIRVPKFESLEAERAHRKLHQAAALRWLGHNGYNNEGAGGHVTVRIATVECVNDN